MILTYFNHIQFHFLQKCLIYLSYISFLPTSEFTGPSPKVTSQLSYAWILRQLPSCTYRFPSYPCEGPTTRQNSDVQQKGRCSKAEQCTGAQESRSEVRVKAREVRTQHRKVQGKKGSKDKARNQANHQRVNYERISTDDRRQQEVRLTAKLSTEQRWHLFLVFILHHNWHLGKTGRSSKLMVQTLLLTITILCNQLTVYMEKIKTHLSQKMLHF